jgi:tripartite-type tricarboxylate transporter receptor subunit TctC
MSGSIFALKNLTSLRVFTVSMLLLCSLTKVSAQEEPMVFLTSHSAAGSSGVAAAIMAPRIEEYLGRPIEFRYNQGSSAAVGDAPDGNTMLMTTIGYMALHPVWRPNYELDPLTDLRAVTRLAVTPDILIVRSGLGIDTLDELIAYAAAADEPLSYFYIAPYSIHRVELAAIFSEFDIDNVALDASMRPGPVQALAAIEAGTLDLLVVTSPYVVPLLESGAANALIVIHRERTPIAPDVPTLLEQGVTTMPYGSWSGIFVPAGTSDEDTNLIFEAIKFAVADPAVEKQINALGMEVDLSESPEEFIGFLKSEAARLNIAVDKYGLRGN